MTDFEEHELRDVVDKHIEEMLNDIIGAGHILGTWPRDTGAITTIVVEVLKHQYRTSVQPA